MRNYFIPVAVAFAAMFISSCNNDELEPTTTAFGKGTAQAMIGGAKKQINWVQLWKDGPKFAEFNVGATAIDDYGGLYAWGGLYNLGGDDYYTGEGPLPANRDVATQKWGANWRMPTYDEMNDLINNCTVQSTARYGKGLIFIGKGDYNENSIFLPAAGVYASNGNYYEAIGQDGLYWISDYSGGALGFRINLTTGYHHISMGGQGHRTCCSVRAVLK